MVIQDKMVRRKISYPHKSIEKYVKLHYNILPNSMTMPGADARENIDKLLLSAGWQIQDVSKINLGAGYMRPGSGHWRALGPVGFRR